MDSQGLEKEIEELKLKEKQEIDTSAHSHDQLKITSFSEIVNDVSLHFQIIRFPKQVFPSPSIKFSSFCFQVI